MSDRPKWMPEETVILEIQDGEYIDGEIDDAFRKTGVRAQIDVLEELVEHMTKQFICAANPQGEYCDEESIWIGHKLIRLRKELGE